MFDIWWGDIELTTLTIVVSVLVLLPAQLLLCYRAGRLSARLAPAAVLLVLVLLLLAMWIGAAGWDGLFYAIFAIFAGFMLFTCGIGWAVWAAARGWKRRRQ